MIRFRLRFEKTRRMANLNLEYTLIKKTEIKHKL